MEGILSEKEIEDKLAFRPLWKLRNGKLYRNFQAKNFHEAMAFLTSIGHISDTHHHHPDIHLTNYKYIEVELSTPRVNGITNMDFQMADLFDAIPVDYSLLWKHSHPQLVTEQRLPVPPTTPPQTHKYDTIFPHRTHRPETLVNPMEKSSVHSDAYSNAPGAVHHSQRFVVDTATHTPLGESDMQHHAEAYAHSRPRSSSGTALIRRHSSTFEKESEAWNSMARALHALVDRGYDVGISNALLPMVNAHEVFPSWEEEMHTAYVHLNKRLSPAWLETEPPEVIAACREFVDGYNTIFADNFMT